MDNFGIEERDTCCNVLKKFIHNAVVIGIQFYYNVLVTLINPTVHSMQEKNRKLLHHIGTALETAGTISGSTSRYPQRFQLPLLPARGSNLKMELRLHAF